MSGYDFKTIESKWTTRYKELETYKGRDFDDKKEKFYMLTEFPYPSGSGLHVGHAFSMTGADVYARFQRMKGKNVMFPMGWDAFGLPAENYAIKTGTKPQERTREVVENFREQMDKLGFSFDWDREVNTTLPDYYKWTQWIFTKLFEKELATKQEMPINWCPKDKIGLANEEVINGNCERCGTKTEKRTISQWVVRITAYADRLLEGLKETEFIEKVKAAQTNWIDRKEGAKIRFEVSNFKVKPIGLSVENGLTRTEQLPEGKFYLEVFTTRPDTLHGATFVVVAPEHFLVSQVMEQSLGMAPEVRAYVESVKNKSDLERTDLSKEKTGVFSGLYAVNPLSKKEVPIWIGDYVTMSYGTGAVMAVPAHDERDFDFAKKFSLPITPVIMPQRHYVDKDARGYYDRRQKKNREYLQLFNDMARENGKTLLITGGWAVAMQVGYEYRECEDIDVAFLKTEKEWWNNKLREIGFEVGPIFGQKNPEEYYQAVRKPSDEVDTHIDIDIVDDTNSFEEKDFGGKVFWVMKKEEVLKAKLDELAEGKDQRWKEEADFLMLGYKPYVGEGKMINTVTMDGVDSWEAKDKVIGLAIENGFGERAVTYHLRDWIFSRQHYWGEPIPMIYCEQDGWVSVPEEQLPVVLPEVEKYQPTDTGESPLANIKEWVEASCPKCGGRAKRETDTMPNWAGSDWYFLRYCDPKNDKELASMDKMNYWLPVDVYVGGDEHNTLHLLYSRFIYQFLWGLGVVPKKYPEPYKKRLSHGVILGPDGNRMSKSKGNVIEPGTVADVYGSDSIRTYMMFMGPFDATMAWNERSLVGVKRFIEKFYRMVVDQAKDSYEATDEKSLGLVHRLVKKVGDDVAAFKFNTAIAKMMEVTNELSREGVKLANEELSILVRLLAPFAPFVTEELWSILGRDFSIHGSDFPTYDVKYLIEDTVTLSVQVNGKLRGTVVVNTEADEMSVVGEVKKVERINRYLDGMKIKRVVYVKGKAINFVVE